MSLIVLLKTLSDCGLTVDQAMTFKPAAGRRTKPVQPLPAHFVRWIGTV